MNFNKVPLAELQDRMIRFRAQMDRRNPEWQMTAILGKVNLYYFTGSMQDGLLLIPRDGEAVYWVRRSYERAMDESLFPRIEAMASYRDAARATGKCPATVHLETELVPLAQYQRLRKYFPFTDARAADFALSVTRAFKSPYELKLMEQAGEIHRRVMEEQVPRMLRQGMSEADLGAELFSALIAEGHHGVARFGAFETDIVVGYLCFGESSIYPACVNSPGGNYGMGPAVPMFGSRDRKLKAGDMVFIDSGAGAEGYHSDKSLTYMFGKPLPKAAYDIQERCVEIQDRIASMLVPGMIPSKIYFEIMKALEPAFLENFMGFGTQCAKFLGHGIGLVVDEWPVIAEGFDEPLEEGMVLAIEPKRGMAGVGLLGIENTFLVTPKGGRSISGKSRGLVPVSA